MICTPDGGCAAGPVPSETMVSTCDSAMIGRKCTGARSGGQSTTRRATPSSCSSARSAGSCRSVEISTDRPRKASGDAPRLLPSARSARATQPEASETNRRDESPAVAVSLQSERQSRCSILVKLYEIAERNGEPDIAILAKGIEVKAVVQGRDEHCKAKGVESGLHKCKIVGQRGYRFLLLRGDPRDLGDYRFSDRHD